MTHHLGVQITRIKSRREREREREGERRERESRESRNSNLISLFAMAALDERWNRGV